MKHITQQSSKVKLAVMTSLLLLFLPFFNQIFGESQSQHLGESLAISEATNSTPRGASSQITASFVEDTEDTLMEENEEDRDDDDHRFIKVEQLLMFISIKFQTFFHANEASSHFTTSRPLYILYHQIKAYLG